LSTAFRPIAADALPGLLAEFLDRTPGRVRVGLDGPPCACPDELAASLVEPLRARGRDAVHLRAGMFWRDASLRLEHGREDVESFATWLDDGALRREALDPFAAFGRYLPSLREPATNRATREAVREAGEQAVLILSGPFLLGRGLPFEQAIHLDVSPAARARRTPPEDAWTLPAYDAYARRVRPAQVADVVLRMDDPRHPASRGL
jgi:hypothetical protein